MEASAVPREAPAGVHAFTSPRLLRVASDAHLVGLIREGRTAAFEAVYDRHHRAILSFCRHMLGSTEEAEDALQQTFLSAYNDLIASDKQIHLRAWLFTIARNRCYSMLRARREQPVGELDETATEGLAAQVQRRQDLRDLVFDLQRLPDDQRAALVLAEMDALGHDQIATVLGVPPKKVKALVFQARESLIASRAARETDCSDIREQLSNLTGGALRRANLRRHLRECSGCRDFRQQIDRQRRQLRIVLPVAPTLALKEAVLAATIGGGAGVGAVTAGGGGAFAGSLLKGGVFKGLIGAALAGVGTAGTLVAVHDIQVGVASTKPIPHRLVSRAPFTPAPAARTNSGSVGSATAHAGGISRTSGTGAYATLPGGQAIGFARYAGAGAGAKAAKTAFLDPLSRTGLSDQLIANPLLPNAAGSAPAAGPAPGVSLPTGHTSRLSPAAPFLGPSAFAVGGSQPSDVGGGGTAASSTSGASVPGSGSSSRGYATTGSSGAGTSSGTAPSGSRSHTSTLSGSSGGSGGDTSGPTSSSGPSGSSGSTGTSSGSTGTSSGYPGISRGSDPSGSTGSSGTSSPSSGLSGSTASGSPVSSPPPDPSTTAGSTGSGGGDAGSGSTTGPHGR
jgi:RNA polymerase sigma factor (sigma-70 family)